jgi:hypothetical protein
LLQARAGPFTSTVMSRGIRVAGGLVTGTDCLFSVVPVLVTIPAESEWPHLSESPVVAAQATQFHQDHRGNLWDVGP